MKKVVIFFIGFLILFSFLSIVYAETKDDVKLKIGESTTIGGKVLTLIGISSGQDKVLVDIDGIKTNVKVIDIAINYYGINITVVDMEFYRTGADSVVFDLSIGFECGNDKCEGGKETSKTCCKDCNCTTGYICIENRCIEEALNECSVDADCNDSNACTTENCSGIPRKCVRSNNTCGPRDDCCLPDCPMEDDPDCYLCEFDLDCDDNNTCTVDACKGHKCIHEEKGCVYNNECIEIGQVVNNLLCSENGTLVEQVVEEEIKEVEKKGFFSRFFGRIIDLIVFWK